MGRLLALADLHLSLSGEKPMDIFGEIWQDHTRRIESGWEAAVSQDDTVLLPGDLSWARTLAGARADLAWIGSRPGRKLLLKGNHDSWWNSLSQVREALPESCAVLQNDSVRVAGRVIVGARGWTAPDDPIAQPGDGALFNRELERLKLSVADADRTHGRELPRIAMLHYPPWTTGRPPTAVVEILQRAGVRACVYGHLHGEDLDLAVVGSHAGIDYYCVSCDAVDFTPVEIVLPEGE